MNKRRLRDTDLCGDLCISIITQTLRVFIWLLLHLINTPDHITSPHFLVKNILLARKKYITKFKKERKRHTSLSALSSFIPPSSSSSGGSPSLLPSSRAASFISTLTCSLSPSVRNQRSSVVSDTMAVSSSCARDSWHISQTTTVMIWFLPFVNK